MKIIKPKLVSNKANYLNLLKIETGLTMFDKIQIPLFPTSFLFLYE